MEYIIKRLLENHKKMNESLSLEDIQNAKGSSSFMDDYRPIITIDGREYIKIGKNKWQIQHTQAHVIGGIINDHDMYEKVLNGNEVKYENL